MQARDRTYDTVQLLVGAISCSRVGQRVVFTNGCFDLLHVGHLRSLESAKELGDVLIVGINSDLSVTKLKGSGRPIVNDARRAEMVAGLHPVDYAFIFHEDTALESLKVLRPNVYVKSSDYDLTTTPEGQYAIANGIEVRTLDFHPDNSSTQIITSVVAATSRRRR